MTFLHRFEFHRSGIGLVPEPGEDGTAVWLEEVPEASGSLRHCTCETSRKRTCSHLQELTRGIRAFQERFGRRSWGETFAKTLWHRLAALLAEEDGLPFSAVRPAQMAADGGTALGLLDDRGHELVRVFDASPARLRLLERLGTTAGEGPWRDRSAVLTRLVRFQLTRQERVLEAAGMKSRRQKAEESLWYRLAYHCARELDEAQLTFHPAIDQSSGAFTLTCRHNGDEPVLRLTVPRLAVQRVLELLASVFPTQEDLSIHPVPLRTLFRVDEATEIEGEAVAEGQAEDVVDVRPVLVALQEDGEKRYIERDDFEKFRYGRLVYLPELGVLAELEVPGRERKFRAPRRLQLFRSQVPGFLDDHRAEVAEGDVVFEGGLAGVKVFREADAVEFGAGDLAEAETRSWYWLSVRYAFGDARVPLADLLEARRQGLPFYEIPGGWVDLSSPELRAAERVFEGREPTGSDANDGRLRVSLAELLRFGATSEAPVRIAAASSGQENGPSDVAEAEASRQRAELLERLLTLQPSEPFASHEGLTSALRPYQLHGVEWLRFLAENRLSGLLCDDMGLGKTHQAMALMVSLRQQNDVEEPFLVVCPTTVLNHWQGKIRDHAPGLEAVLHHGPGRDVTEGLAAGDVLLTSYGVLRNDIEELEQVRFGLVVFDEIQNLKNPATRSWEAASRIDANIRLGLTGTPIENSLSELKALFDLVLPGYLGSDEEFEDRYGDAETPGADAEERAPLEDLRRTVSPFILRRTKAAVLDELPDKFEDLRFALLSDDQVALYRRLVGERGNELAGKIRSGDEPVPYIHIFALLNHLKQVCDHPALALGDLDRADELGSGKWDLFSELLAEALGNRQKVVVFTQYLGMITLMERLLERMGVEHAVLTGSSTNRGEIVDRFNRDPDCRVFLGSLKAGGTGIDLVGGSVVVHYDRWWNAAREDQATDRVYRIGQKRAVQVFKLITEGTLEEKIHAIIERKRRLAASVVQEDSPRLAKIFTREELLELLQPV